MLDVVPLTGKTAEECVKALDTVMEKMHAPNYVYTDSGGEFKGPFDKRLGYYFVEHIVTRTHAPFAERVIRTLREGLDARLTATDTSKKLWWKMLGYVVNQYNETVHVTTGEAPNDIHHLNMEDDKEWIDELRQRIIDKAHFNRKYPMIKVGDTVKILKKPGKRGEFKIGFKAWSTETYPVTKIEFREGMPLFFLEGLKEPLRNHEIMRVNAVQKPPQSLSQSAATPRRIRGKTTPPPAAAAAIPEVPPPVPDKPMRKTKIRGKTPDPSAAIPEIPDKPTRKTQIRGKTPDPRGAPEQPQPGPPPTSFRKIVGKTLEAHAIHLRPVQRVHPLAIV